MSDDLANDLAALRIERSAPPRRTWPKVLATVAVVGALGWAGLAVGRPWLEARVFKAEVDVTEIARVSPAQATVDLTATGYVIPQSTAKVGAKIVGRIAKVQIREGQTVKAGDTLFELDPADQQATVASARARVAAANARVATARAQWAEVKLNRDRTAKLVESGSAPRATLDDLEARLAALDAQIKAAEAEVAASQAEATALSAGLANYRIFAPIDGTAITKPSSVGDIVGPAALGANGATSLVDLVDMKSLLVEVDVPEAKLGLAKPSGPCEIVLDALPQQRFRGVVVELAPRLNRAKATGVVKVRFVDAPDTLRPEMSARVSFLQKALGDAELAAPPKVIVPATALVDRGGAKFVWVIDAGKVRLVPISLGAPFGTGFEVQSGPPPGTRLVKDPPGTLTDGQAVSEKAPS
jgi:RND family efflux transporter MFP subunit